MELKFYDCTQENLEKVYADYVKKVDGNKNCRIQTNVVCMVNYKKPSCSGGPSEYIKTDYKLITSSVIIYWSDGYNVVDKKPFIGFWFQNVSQSGVIKFARMEDIDWDNV